MKKILTPLMAAAGLTLFGNSAEAQFQYFSRDLLLTLRTDAVSGSDLEVNLGSISNYLNYASANPGGTLNLTNFNNAQFLAARDSGSATNLFWAVSGAANSTDANAPSLTLWVTRPRSDVNTVAAAWTRKTPSSQSASAGSILGVGNNLKTWSAGTSLDPVSNTSQAVVIANNDPNSYTGIAGTGGDLGGSFQGVIENGFTKNFSGFVVSDLFAIRPSSSGGAGTLVGSFRFNSDGTTAFIAPVPEPSTFLLGGLGAIAFAVRRFRSRKP